MNNGKTYMRSLSNEDFKSKFPNPSAEGLRKLAMNYKNSKQGQIDFERFKNSAKSPKKPIDPRFRKTRVSPTCEITANSDNKVQSSFHTEKSAPATAVSSMPNTPKRSPRKRSKVPVLRSASPTTPELNSVQDVPALKDSLKESTENISVQVDSLVDELEKIDANDKVAIHEKFHKMETIDKILAWTEECGKMVEPPEFVQHVDPPPSRVKAEQSPQPTSSDKPRAVPTPENIKYNGQLLNKYVSIPVEIRVKRSKSALTIPFSFPKTLSPRVCMCVKCSCIMARGKRNFFEYNPSMGDGSHIVTNPNDYSSPKTNKRSRHIETCTTLLSYCVGIVVGLLIVSCLGWFLSNDIIWNLVKEPQRKPTPPIYALISALYYCANLALSTFNFIFGTIANILLLPRNSVYSSVE